MKEKNIFPHLHKINRNHRIKLSGHNSFVVWFTGLSGSGKSTIASRVEEELFKRGYRTYILDGDNVRSGLNKDLGFNDADREENIRRVSEVAKMMCDAGIIVFCSFISPLEKERALAKKIIGEDNFIQVYLKCSIAECEKRDKKGIYKKARNGEIKDFIGIHQKFEEPFTSDLVLNTEREDIEKNVENVLKFILPKTLIKNDLL